MDSKEEKISGHVRSLEEAGIETGRPSRREELMTLSHEELLKIIEEKEMKSILEDAVLGNWPFATMMEHINRFKFPPVEYSDALFDPDPEASSVATPKSLGAKGLQLDMSQFKYQMLAAPEHCGWKQVRLPDSMLDFVCATLFGGDTAALGETLETYGTHLRKLRDVYGYHREHRRRVNENQHFRPTFTLWLGHLLHSISPSWEVNVKNRGAEKLSFTALLSTQGDPNPAVVDVKGHEDVMIKCNGHVLILGEYKTPFSALYPSERAQQFYQAALSQMYAEMQGFMGKSRGTAPPTAMAETAAAVAADSSEESQLWCVSFLTDGFALRVSLASKQHLAADTQGLPTVYTSANASVLDPCSFTATILYMLAVTITNDPQIDFAASSDVNVAVNQTFPATDDGPDGDGPNGTGEEDHQSPRDPTRSSHHTVDEGDEEEDGGSYTVDRYVMTRDDDYLEFLEAEEEEVDRLNSLLASSFAKEGRLSKHALQTLGTRSLVF